MAFGSSVLTHKKEQQIKIAGEFKPTVDCLCAIRRGLVCAKKDLGWDRGVESKKVVQHVYLVGAKSIYRVAEKDEEYLRDEEEKNQNTACGASCWRRGSLHPNASQVFG